MVFYHDHGYITVGTKMSHFWFAHFMKKYSKIEIVSFIWAQNNAHRTKIKFQIDFCKIRIERVNTHLSSVASLDTAWCAYGRSTLEIFLFEFFIPF